MILIFINNIQIILKIRSSMIFNIEAEIERVEPSLTKINKGGLTEYLISLKIKELVFDMKLNLLKDDLITHMLGHLIFIRMFLQLTELEQEFIFLHEQFVKELLMKI
ncbi:hypothetical protein P344_07130 [Spiroplasma mirum ATCC 29335]|uniref:Uncharacterized protein n=1 Tax=Spiroplasma mirum ATCC 29335 TaxID=838561 RepID=W6ANG2_9MOLU|nr:hypothetical protein P344_07130 [Spiroplasma mirum ATCC 29335]